MRQAKLERKTNETDIRVELDIDGSGRRDISTGIGFFDHMLDLFAKHGLFDLKVYCKGDTWVDDHHSIEDIGMTMGQAFKKALGDMKGIRRYGQRILPMDEALVLCAVDMGGRPSVISDVEFRREMINDMSTECVHEFFIAFSTNAGMNIGIKMLAGSNDHHKIEAIFKACARALREACEPDERAKEDIPSTKGVL